MIKLPFIHIPYVLPIYTIRAPKELVQNKYGDLLQTLTLTQNTVMQQLLMQSIFESYARSETMYVIRSDVKEWLNTNCKRRWDYKTVEGVEGVFGMLVQNLQSADQKVEVDFSFRSKKDAALFKMFWC